MDFSTFSQEATDIALYKNRHRVSPTRQCKMKIYSSRISRDMSYMLVTQCRVTNIRRQGSQRVEKLMTFKFAKQCKALSLTKSGSK